jgi:hypothetical protein
MPPGIDPFAVKINNNNNFKMSFEDADNLTRPEFIQHCVQLPSFFVNGNEPLDNLTADN